MLREDQVSASGNSCDNAASNTNNTQELDTGRESDSNPDSGFQIPDVPKPSPNEDIEDWAGEVGVFFFVFILW